MTTTSLRRLVAVLLAACGASAVAAPASTPGEIDPAKLAEGRVAVMSLLVRLPAGASEASSSKYFEDALRAAVKRDLPSAQVLTRESLDLLISENKVVGLCDSDCEVKQGRQIGANLIVTGELVRVGTQLKLSLRLHETEFGQLLTGTVAAGQTVDEVDQALPSAVVELLAPLTGKRPAGERALRVATGPSAGYLTILSQPRAKVTLDSFAAGQTPLRRLAVDAGAHILVLTAPGFETVRKDISVESGKELTLTETLKEATGVVDLSVVPPGAALMLDGNPVRAGVLPNVPIGDHQVRGEADGYTPAEKTFEVLKGKTTRIKLELARLAGRLVLTADAGAFCEVDGGKSQPVTAGKGLQVPLAPGLHVVSCRQEGYEPFRQEFEVFTQRDTPVTAHLVNLQAKARAQRWAMIFGGVAAVGAGAAGYGFWKAGDARTRLDTAPAADRPSLQSEIDQANTIGVVGASVGGVGAALAVYYLLSY